MSQLCSSKMNVTFLRVYFHGTDTVGPLIHCPKQGLDESNMKRIVGRSLKFWSTQSIFCYPGQSKSTNQMMTFDTFPSSS